MKKLISLTLFIFLVLQVFAQNNTQAPALSEPGSYTWILLPDLQTYQKFERNQAIFDLMVAWILDQQEDLNIQMVLCVGDLVEQNNLLVPDNKNGNQKGIEQWKSVSSSFARLDNKIPYILCTGNHDYGIKNAENRFSNFNSFFPPIRDNLSNDYLIEMAPNAQGVPTLENACYSWTSPIGQEFLIFSLEFAPRIEVLKWAKEIAADKKYKNHIGVVLTHTYIDSEGRHIEKENYPLTDANYGATIWKELVKPSPNIQFVFSGHIASSTEHQGQVAYRKDKIQSGKDVHQVLFNAQREGGDWHGNGGDGWLRILEFTPNEKTVKVSTFSPLFYISPSTRHLSRRMESFDHFTIQYE